MKYKKFFSVVFCPLLFLTFLNINTPRTFAQTICSSSICVNYDASGCYTYNSIGNNIGQTTLTLTKGALRKTSSIINSNPASLFQTVNFNSPDYNCALGAIDTYYRVERIKADFVTPLGLMDFPNSSAWPVPSTRFLYYGTPSAIASVAIPARPDTAPSFYSWNYLTRLTYAGLTDLSQSMSTANEDAIINNVDISHTLNLRFRVIYTNGNIAEPQFANTSAPATNCVALSGTGAQKVVITRSSQQASINDFMWQATDLRDAMVQATSTPSQYSFYVDLKKRDRATFVPAQSSCVTGFTGAQYIFIQATPVITTISPPTVAPGGNIVISGSNFASTGNTIQFTNIATAQIVTVPNVPSNGTSMTFAIPDTLIAGSYTVKVQTSSNTLWSNGVSLQVQELKIAPVINSIRQRNPNQVVITGSDFSATGNSVQFVYKTNTSKIYEATNIPSANSGTVLTFNIPNNMPSMALFETYYVKVGALNSDWSNQLLFPVLPQLGMYQQKLGALQANVVVAKNIMQGKRDKVLMDQKGAEVLNVTDQINGPLFLLKKLEKYIETDANGSLKDHAGFVKFFTYLRFLKKFNEPALSGVFQSASEMTGFSYLFPPSPNKPMLISVAGAGGEGGWRGARSLLSAESTNFNIVVYTLDASALSSEMTDIFLSKFIASGLTEQESVFVTLSMGSTFIHSAILKDMQNGQENFSKSYMVITGFLPGGAQEFVGLASVIVPVMPYVYPISRGISDVMNPLNPIYTNIANNITQIATKTKGIFYIQASNDHHTSNTITSNPYANNRDKTLLGMINKIYVTPPNNYINNDGLIEQNNQHINLLYAPEVKSKIDGYRTLLAQLSVIGAKNQSAASFWGVPDFVGKGFQFLWNFFKLNKFFPVVSAQSQPSEIEFDVIDDIFGGPKQSICTSSVEVLRDSLLISDMDYDIYASEISKYISLTNAGCTIDNILEDSIGELQVLPLSTSVPVSGATNLSFALDLTGVTSVDLVIDGNVVSTDSTFPWNPLFDSTKFSNGSHTAKVVFHFSASKPSVTTKEISIKIDNGNLLTPTLTINTSNISSTYKLGDTLPIKWTSTGVEKVNINLLDYKGSTIIRTIATVSASLGQYDWKVSDIDFSNSSTYVISVSDVSNPALKSKSGKIDFTPAPTPVTVLPWTAVTSVQAGQPLTYTLNWSGGPLDKSWRVFAHLVKDDNSHTFTAGDFLPNPTTNSWSGNVRTAGSVTIPAGTPPGTYKVMVGLYNGAPRVQNLIDGKDVTSDTQYRHQVGTITILAPIQTQGASIWDAISGFFGKLFGF